MFLKSYVHCISVLCLIYMIVAASLSCGILHQAYSHIGTLQHMGTIKEIAKRKRKFSYRGNPHILYSMFSMTVHAYPSFDLLSVLVRVSTVCVQISNINPNLHSTAKISHFLFKLSLFLDYDKNI